MNTLNYGKAASKKLSIAGLMASLRSVAAIAVAMLAVAISLALIACLMLAYVRPINLLTVYLTEYILVSSWIVGIAALITAVVGVVRRQYVFANIIIGICTIFVVLLVTSVYVIVAGGR